MAGARARAPGLVRAALLAGLALASSFDPLAKNTVGAYEVLSAVY